MNRKEFLKNGAALGIGLPFLSLLLDGCDDDFIDNPELTVNFSGKVLIVGGALQPVIFSNSRVSISKLLKRLQSMGVG